MDIPKQWLDKNGRVKQWPTRKHPRVQKAIINLMASKFEVGRTYSEYEVNTILRHHHTFDDWAMLRRELFERHLLFRNRDGSAYWRNPDKLAIDLDNE